MKKKKALLVLIVAAIIAALGGLGYLALNYFSSSARSSNAGGDLSIDYLVTEEDTEQDDTQAAASKNIFQWLKERLAADKAQGEVTLQTETSGPSSTQSGMSQSIHQTENDEETDLNPVQQAVKDAQQTNSSKKKDNQERNEKKRARGERKSKQKDASQIGQPNPSSSTGQVSEEK